MKIFNLPDLGEGLPEAEVVQWHVNIGDHVVEDQPLVSVETAKAIVEIPSPNSGTISKLFADAGEFVQTGDPLVEFDAGEAVDSGTVVGEVKTAEDSTPTKSVDQLPTGTQDYRAAAPNVKATPAVRALARRLEVDLHMVSPGGKDGMVTAADVQRVAKILAKVGPQKSLHGARRAMARKMSQAHAEVVPVAIVDDADVHAWSEDADTMARLVRAIAAGCAAEPSLNAWYDGHAIGRRLLTHVDLGIAVDSEGGLFVPVLRDVARLSAADVRARLDELREKVKARSLSPDEMRGATITLTNFGMMAGKYANPVVIPPTVAILGAGRLHDEVVAVNGEPGVHPVLPLSLTFDHRAVTGGESARFLAAVIADLQSAD